MSEQSFGRIMDGLRLLGHDVWLDEALTGGQPWWDAILGQIRQCDAFLVVVSPALLESEACRGEREYATQLKKKVVPVMLKDVPSELLPPDLAVLQVVDFTESGQGAAFRLAAALANVTPGSVLPEPLPPPPPVPLSYLTDISKRVHAHSLTLDEQNGLIAQLRTAVRRPDEYDSAIDLLRVFGQRPDLYHEPAVEAEKLLAEARTGRPRGPTERRGSNGTPQWSVELMSKKKAERTLEVTRHATHKICWRSRWDPNSFYYRYYDYVTVDGHMVQEGRYHRPRTELQFLLDDDEMLFPVSVKITWNEVDFWRDKVNSFDLYISGHPVYHDDG